MMKILAIDTSTDACSVALRHGSDTFMELKIEPQAHARLILGQVDLVLRAAEVGLDEVDLFAFGQGPGSFTGLRIAASVIQGLAFGVGKPVIAVSSLQALAQQAANLGFKKVISIVDARMQEVYCGEYVVNDQGLVDTQTEDCLKKPAELIVAPDCVAVGTGCKEYVDLLLNNNPELKSIADILYPRATEIAQLAEYIFAQGVNILTPADAQPVYVRNDVVQTGKKNPD